MDNNSLEINTTDISSICSKYNEIIDTIGLDYNNVMNDFKPFLNCGVLSSYIPDLKDNIDKVVLSTKEMINYIDNFAKEQEKIDTTSNATTSIGDTSYSSNGASTGEEKTINEDGIKVLFTNDEFLNVLFTIITEYPDLISDASKHELLKELLIKSNVNQEVLTILENNDSKVIQVTLGKVLTGEINTPETLEFIENVKKIIATVVEQQEVSTSPETQ